MALLRVTGPGLLTKRENRRKCFLLVLEATNDLFFRFKKDTRAEVQLYLCTHQKDSPKAPVGVEVLQPFHG